MSASVALRMSILGSYPPVAAGKIGAIRFCGDNGCVTGNRHWLGRKRPRSWPTRPQACQVQLCNQYFCWFPVGHPTYSGLLLMGGRDERALPNCHLEQYRSATTPRDAAIKHPCYQQGGAVQEPGVSRARIDAA